MQRATKQDHGLSNRELNIILKVLAPFHLSIESAGLFGSRACGQFKPYSDIDLVLFGNLKEQEVARIYTLLDDSSLGVNVDVLAYSHTHYPPLKRHIDEMAKQLFSYQEIKTGRYAA